MRSQLAILSWGALGTRSWPGVADMASAGIARVLGIYAQRVITPARLHRRVRPGTGGSAAPAHACGAGRRGRELGQWLRPWQLGDGAGGPGAAGGHPRAPRCRPVRLDGRVPERGGVPVGAAGGIAHRSGVRAAVRGRSGPEHRVPRRRGPAHRRPVRPRPRPRPDVQPEDSRLLAGGPVSHRAGPAAALTVHPERRTSNRPGLVPDAHRRLRPGTRLQRSPARGCTCGGRPGRTWIRGTTG